MPMRQLVSGKRDETAVKQKDGDKRIKGDETAMEETKLIKCHGKKNLKSYDRKTGDDN